jgi:hypothetical protein
VTFAYVHDRESLNRDVFFGLCLCCLLFLIQHLYRHLHREIHISLSRLEFLFDLFASIQIFTLTVCI